MIREITCIVCPIGCSICVETAEGSVLSVEGNRCPRGKIYAENECTNPLRIVTSTVRCKNGKLLSVKTDKPIPKGKVEQAMKMINAVTVDLPICIGDVIIKDVYGADIVATANLK